jgi:hypothetical protein
MLIAKGYESEKKEELLAFLYLLLRIFPLYGSDFLSAGFSWMKFHFPRSVVSKSLCALINTNGRKFDVDGNSGMKKYVFVWCQRNSILFCS